MNMTGPLKITQFLLDHPRAAFLTLSLIILTGVITAIGKSSEVTVPDGYERVDCGDSVIMPGLVELHCHIASPSFDLNDNNILMVRTSAKTRQVRESPYLDSPYRRGW